jgi:hypothetical protein
MCMKKYKISQMNRMSNLKLDEDGGLIKNALIIHTYIQIIVRVPKFLIVKYRETLRLL